jgi:hypothetical protein
VDVYQEDTLIQWTGGLRIDADGAPNAYAPPNSGLHGLDALGNAGHGPKPDGTPANWWGICTKSGKPDGAPVIQGPDDPAPGYYVSPTALCDKGYQEGDPRRYVDSTQIPYISIPKELRQMGVRQGDVAYVEYNGVGTAAIVADSGPAGKLGEGSIALAVALGINSSPRIGGASSGVTTQVWVGSGKGWPRAWADVEAQVAALRGAQVLPHP